MFSPQEHLEAIKTYWRCFSFKCFHASPKYTIATLISQKKDCECCQGSPCWPQEPRLTDPELSTPQSEPRTQLPGFSGRLINLLAREPHGDEGFSHQLGHKTPVPHRPCILGRNPGCSAGNNSPCNTSCTPNGSGTRDWQGDCKEGTVGLHQCQAILLSPVTDQNQPQIRKC